MKKATTAFILILIIMYYFCYQEGKRIKNSTATTTIESVQPPEFTEIQGETVKLADVEGFMIESWPVAGGGETYVLRLRGVAHEFEFSTHDEAEQVGIYLCMLKGERL